jgi:signal transduction histidine kinase
MRWFVALALLSAAGLLAVGFVGLWRAVRDAERVAVAESQRSAALTAKVARARLLDERERRDVSAGSHARPFTLVDGALVPPPALTWTDEPPAERSESELPLAVADLVRTAERATANGDVETAVAAFDRALATSDLTPGVRAHVLLDAAWDAHRHGDVDRRERLLGEALTVVGDGFTRLPRGLLGSAALLAAATGRELGVEWLERGLGLLPRAARDALFEEIAQRGWSSPWRALPKAEFAAAFSSLDREREVVRLVRPLVPSLWSAREPVVEAVGGERGEILVYWPPPPSPSSPDAKSSGHGVVGSPKELLPDLPLVVGATLPDDAAPVAPGVSVLAPAPRLESGLLASPVAIGIVLATLAATFALGLTLALATLRREAALTRARAEFLTSVTHELKTPLASIRLFAEMLLEGRVASEAKRDEYHRLLAGETERLSTLIENVLDLGRLERGERALDVHEQPLDDVVRDTLERFAPLAERDGLALEAKWPSAPLVASVDRGAVAQALLNLLDNARKYARSGGRAEVELARAGELARLAVRDFGPGVPEEERAAIFERFVRGERQQDGATPGLGLGLHLARSLVRALHGELECVAPRDGRGGACFVVTLPLATTATTPVRAAGAAP